MKDDSISRLAALRAVGVNSWAGFRINALPPAEPEQKKGKWVWNEDGVDWGLGAWCCSECGRKPETWWESDKRNNPLNFAGSRFCGNCGADMKEEDHENDNTDKCT